MNSVDEFGLIALYVGFLLAIGLLVFTIDYSLEKEPLDENDEPLVVTPNTKSKSTCIECDEYLIGELNDTDTEEEYMCKECKEYLDNEMKVLKERVSSVESQPVESESIMEETEETIEESENFLDRMETYYSSLQQHGLRVRFQSTVIKFPVTKSPESLTTTVEEESTPIPFITSDALSQTCEI